MEKFTMPAEYEPHSATIMIWCERGGSWIYGGKYARPVFAKIIKEISAGEKVYLAVSEKGKKSAEKLLKNEIKSGAVELLDIPTDDCWARDTAPTFIKSGNKLKGVDWAFNAWGGEYDGLYKNYFNDDKFARNLCVFLGEEVIPARPFVLEGGSVHSNGKGVILTTEECLLSKGRNPGLTKEQIEEKLKEFLGAERVIWLPYGVCGDETNGHVDNICAFTSENEVVLGWTDKEGEQRTRCEKNLAVLESEGFKVRKLPFPEKPVTFTPYELKGFSYEEGEDTREEGEILAASYVNFYVCNAGVLVPQFGDINDGVATAVLKQAFPNKKIISVFARDIILGGGNIHCLTQQIPSKECYEKD